MNLIVVLGFNVAFVTSTFGLKELNEDELAQTNRFGEIKSMLFSSALMYLVLAVTLEFIKKTDLMILIIMLTFGVFKIFVRPMT